MYTYIFTIYAHAHILYIHIIHMCVCVCVCILPPLFGCTTQHVGSYFPNPQTLHQKGDS